MPCVEVGDSIVRVARQTLELSVRHVNERGAGSRSSRPPLSCRCVYGDTDSVFILFERASKQEAFEASYRLTDEITHMNVKPVKLKFEKIYLPSILLAKKRYLGYMFETPEQLEPTLDVKGIEIIRRDGCRVASRLLERSCRILFEFKDVAKVRAYVLAECTKLVNARVNLKDFVLAKEYRGRDTYDNVRSIAACQIANKQLVRDPLTEPLAGERVPYVIVYGTPGMPLYELVRSPTELLENAITSAGSAASTSSSGELKLNYEYYVMKQMLPPLGRIMCLLDVDVFEWVRGVSFKPKICHYLAGMPLPPPSNATTSADGGHFQSRHAHHQVNIINFVYSNDCALCGVRRRGEHSKSASASVKSRRLDGLCDKCASLDQKALARVLEKSRRNELELQSLVSTCASCTSNPSVNATMRNDCCSLDCPTNFRLWSAVQESNKTAYIRQIIEDFF